jgi:hypothetical protein
MKNVTVILLILAVAGINACTKNSTEPGTCNEATIKNYGDPAVDGLGWVLLIKDTANGYVEIPENLAAQYKIDGLPVKVCYVKTDNYLYCLCPQPYRKVQILTIQKQ